MTNVIRSTELIITHNCGEVFSWIPYENIKDINEDNPVEVKCRKCGELIQISGIDPD